MKPRVIVSGFGFKLLKKYVKKYCQEHDLDYKDNKQRMFAMRIVMSNVRIQREDNREMYISK